MDFRYEDESWSDSDWRELLENLIKYRLLTWKEITTLTLGHLNPSQVGTSLASSKGFKKKYGKGNTMKIVLLWFYKQGGVCIDCNTRLELQADHSKPKESFGNPLDADFIENMVLRCRRCNVIKRPSHKYGGNTHLTAETALMWILFSFKPRNLKDFIRMCRIYGMTMANIRMQEGWAMAYWLQKVENFDYAIDDLNLYCDLLLWKDGAITRKWKSDKIQNQYKIIAKNISQKDDLVFVCAIDKADKQVDVIYFRMPISEIPFSHYFTGTKHKPQSLAISYSAPDRKKITTTNVSIKPLPPRNSLLLNNQVVNRNSEVVINIDGYQKSKIINAGLSKRKKIITLDSKNIGKYTFTLS